MDTIDNEGTPTATEPAAAPAPAPAPAPAADAPAGDELLAALDEGFTAAEPGAAPAPEAAAEGEGEDAGEGKPPTPAEGEAPAEGTEAKPDAKAAAPKDPPKEPTAEEKAIEQEITDRGLKGDTATRFRDLANQVRELAPFKEAAEKAGIKDVGDLPKLAQEAGFGRELFAQVQEAGVSAEQYGMLLDYGSAITKAVAGDMKAAEQCWTMMQSEMAAVARLLGREVPGVHDPLDDYPDLKAKVESQAIDRADALETARLRTQQRISEERRQADTTTQRQQNELTEARRKGSSDLDALGAELAGIDPHYAAKAPVLLQQLRAVTSRLPPHEWVAAARELYGAIPTPAPAATPAPAPPASPARKPTPGPMRGSALRQPLVVETDDPMQALEQGLEAAGQ